MNNADKYREYERRKAELARMNLNWKEYEAALRALAKELGV